MKKQADQILFGTAITIDENQPIASCVAIKKNLIVFVGDASEGKSWIGPETKIFHVPFIYPGFIESHAHIIETGQTHHQSILSLEEAQTKEETLQLIKNQVDKTPKGDWIFGIGWDEERWPIKELPRAEDLDKITQDHPIILRRIDTHAVWVNSKALKIGEIDERTQDPEGGKIYRDQLGKPTGILLDRAITYITNHIPKLSIEKLIDFAKVTFQEALKRGITFVHNAATFAHYFKAFQKMAETNQLPLRVYCMAVIPDEFGKEILENGPQKINDFLEVRCLKFFMDGAMGSRGAALIEPYTDDKAHSGLMLWKEENLLPILEKAKNKKFQVAFHAIGDLANRKVLDCYEKVQVNELRWRIEHAQLLARKDIPRFKNLNVIAAMQPLHASADMHWFETRVGKKRMNEGAFVWRSLIDQGAHLAFGSDAPVVDLCPLLGIYTAVTRQDLNENPKGGWMAHEKVTREEALKAYTIQGAYASFREHELGSITVGKFADLTVLSENLLTCETKAILNAKVLMTFVDGQIRYQNEQKN